MPAYWAGSLNEKCYRACTAQVICVAEGAGQEAMEKTLGTDASGNPILQDVGTYLRHAIRKNLEVAALPHCPA